MNILQKKLTNESIEALKKFSEAIELNAEVYDVFAALHQAKLFSYATKQGMTDRFGTRVKKSEMLSLALQVINGMANEIERLKKELEQQSTQNPL